jgi:hypothetical protein
MDKQNVMCTCNGLLFGNKRNVVLIHTTTWMNLKKIMLSERSHSQKTFLYDAISSHLYEMSKIDKSIEMESKLVIPRTGLWRFFFG